MTLNELLRSARQHNIRFKLQNDQLAMSAKASEVPPELIETIRARKAEIIDWLKLVAQDADSSAATIAPQTGNGPFPLSYAQTRLWVIDQMGENRAQYNVPALLALDGAVDADALERVFQALVERHPVLRTTFHEGKEAPSQHIADDARFVLDRQDLSALDETTREARLREIADADMMRPFDLARDLMIRASLVRAGASRYYLLLNLHHIATDGWSMGILFDEISRLYGAFIAKRAADLPPLKLHYADYAVWQRETLATTREEALGYWRPLLEGAPALHNLPLDHARPPVRSYRGDTHAQWSSRALRQRLVALARASDVSLFTLLYAAFTIFLARMSGESDIVLGTPVANRERGELNSIIGFFVNTVPLRVNVDEEETFATHLERCRKVALGAFAHQELPFELLVEALNPQRSLGYSPLVQIMFTLNNGGGGEIRLDGATCAPIEMNAPIAKFDLTVGVGDTEEGFYLSWNFATDLFRAETIQRFCASYITLLEALAENPRAKLADLPLVAAEEEAALLALGTGPEAPWAPEALYKVFEHHAARQPEAIAVIDGEETLTYGALNTLANRLARKIRALGVEPGGRIGIATGKNFAFVTAMVAANKAGAAYVLFPIDAPPARLSFMARDADVGAIIISHRQPLDFDAGGVPCLDPERDETLAGFEAGDLNLPADPSDAAYVVYTSGTTGLPKGAVNTHRGLATLQHWTVTEFGLGPDAIVTSAAGVAFDVVVWETWNGLSSGGRLVLVPKAFLQEPAQLEALVRQHRPTHFWLPTGVMESMASVGLDWPDSIRWTYTGGDRLSGYPFPPSHAFRLFNVYGPAEATIISIAGEVLPDDEDPPNIGRALPNTSAMIVDAKGRLLPRGVVGEVCLSGALVGTGYLNRPELTAEKYVVNRYARPGHEILYKTGDLARWREDGAMDCLGRIDLQVKIRGFRIEPQEVSAEIAQEAGIHAAFVDIVEHYGDKQLVAYCVAEEGQDRITVEAAVKGRLAANLPTYMMPQRFLWLDQLLLTNHGKIDRKALAALALAELGKSRQVNTASPRDPIELALYEIWSSVLLHQNIGIRDSFFDVGGNSIAAIKVMHLINEKFALDLPATEIIAHPTIEALGGQVRGDDGRQRKVNPIVFREGTGEVNVICIHPAGGTAFCYLSLAKELPEAFGVYGVQSVGVLPGEDFLPDVGAMADYYLKLVEPLLDRPCVFTGASFGGFVSYEMSRRLHMAGNHNSVAVLLDSMGMDDPAIRNDRSTTNLEEFREKLVKYNGMYPGIDNAQIEQYHRLYNHNTLCTRTYDCQPSPAPFVLVQAMKGRNKYQLHYLRHFWRQRAQGGMWVKCTEGDHATILEGADVRRVGAIIEQVLNAPSPILTRGRSA